MADDKDKPIVFLKGDRLYLRALELGDLARCQRWINDPQTRVSLASFTPFNEIAERRFIEATADTQSAMHFAIVLNEKDQHIGTLGLANIRWKDRAAEFGIMIGEADQRGKGYCTEATRLILQYAFETLNLHRVQLCAFDFNVAAIRSYENVGFVREGPQRQHSFVNGRYVDHVLYSMLESEYFERKQGKGVD